MRVLLVEPTNTSTPSDGNMVHADTALSVYAQQLRDFDEIRAAAMTDGDDPTIIAKVILFFTQTANGKQAARDFLARLKECTEGRDAAISPLTFRAQLKAIHAWGRQQPADLSRIQQQVLVVNGETDRMVPQQHGRPGTAPAQQRTRALPRCRPRWRIPVLRGLRVEDPAVPRGVGTIMKAFTIDKYGSNDNVRAVQVPDPQLRDDDVLVEIHAASINPLDAKIRDGKVKPVLQYRLPLILGNDLAGVVVRVGSGVRRFKPGDPVYARPDHDRIGTFAELISIKQDDVALKPTGLTMEEAASLPLVALTAWQALVDRAHLKRGQTVLIHAGSGGLGSIAIQLAKHLGAAVATTTSTANVDWVKRLGADIVIDYRNTDFETALSDYDVVFDTLGGDTPQQVLRGAQTRWEAHLGRRPARSRVRQACRRQSDPAAGDTRAELPDPQNRKAPRRELLVPVDGGKRRPAGRDRLTRRLRDHPPGHRPRLPVRVHQGGIGLRRRGTRERQGHRHDEISIRADRSWRDGHTHGSRC